MSWLVITAVVAMLAVGMTYSRWTPGACCGCYELGDDCSASCRTNTTLATYSATVAGVTTTTPPAGDVCDTCGDVNGTYVSQFQEPAPNQCIFTWLGEIEVCSETLVDDQPYQLYQVTIHLEHDGLSTSTPSPAAGHVGITCKLWFYRNGASPAVGAWFRADVAEGGDGFINCIGDLNGLVLSYGGSSTFAGARCDFTSATVTLGV